MHRVAGSNTCASLEHTLEVTTPPYDATSPYQAHLGGLEVGTCCIGGLGITSLGCEGPTVDARLTREL